MLHRTMFQTELTLLKVFQVKGNNKQQQQQQQQQLWISKVNPAFCKRKYKINIL